MRINFFPHCATPWNSNFDWNTKPSQIIGFWKSCPLSKYSKIGFLKLPSSLWLLDHCSFWELILARGSLQFRKKIHLWKTKIALKTELVIFDGSMTLTFLLHWSTCFLRNNRPFHLAIDDECSEDLVHSDSLFYGPKTFSNLYHASWKRQFENLIVGSYTFGC